MCRITRWAVLRDEIEVDPLAGLPCPVARARRERVLSHDEIRVLWAAWLEQGYPFGPLQRLLLLTATRRREAAHMRWDELDDPDAATLWTLPSNRTKNGWEHAIPLSGAARRLIAELPRFAGPYVFTSGDGSTPVHATNSKARDRAQALTKRAGAEVTGWGWHDLRRTARTEMARIGVSDAVAERCLNHAPASLVAIYNRHAYAAEMAAAFELWGAELERIVGAAPAGGNLIAIAGARQ